MRAGTSATLVGALLALLTPASAPAAEVGAPPDVETPAAPAPAPAPSVPGVADQALVRVLITIFNPWSAPETRRRALEDPALTDPRVVPVLTFLLGDRDPEVRASAARALGRFPGDRAVESALIALFARRAESAGVRVAAAQALAQIGGGAAGESLYRVYGDDTEEVPVRQAAGAALEARFPALLGARGPAEVVDRRGRALLTFGGALLGSYGLGAVGGLGRNDAGTAIGVLGGALVGAATAFFLTRTGEISPAQAGWLVSGGGWGIGLGTLAAGALSQDPSRRLVLSLGLVGETAGLVGAISTRKGIPFSAGDVATIDLGGLVGFDLALGALRLSQGGDERAGSAVLLGASVAGLVGSGLLTRSLRFSHGDGVLTVDSGYEGLLLGNLAPLALGTTGHREAGTLLGVGLGLVAGGALAQVTEYDPDDVGFIFVSGSFGKMLGAAGPLLADAGDPAIAGGVMAGSVAALAGAHLLVRRVSYGPGRSALVVFGAGLGFWHGLALGASADSLSSNQKSGAMLLGAGAGGLGAMALSQPLDITGTEVLALVGGTFWGMWFAAWGAALANVSDTGTLHLMLGAGDAGLLASSLLVSPLIKVDARRIGIANLGGLTGAGLASLAAALATKNNDTVITANLIGSAVGLLGGSLLAASLDLGPPPAPAADIPAAPAGPPDHGRSAIGFAPPQLTPLLLPPDARLGGRDLAWGLGLTFFERRGR